MKKSIVFMSALFLLIFSFITTSCESTPKSQKSGKTLNVSVFTMQKGELPPENNKTYKWIEDNFGITFEWEILSTSVDYAIKNMINSGELPDLVEVESAELQNHGCLIDLKPILEQYCPNLMKHYASAWKQMIEIDSEKDSNGNIKVEHIYSLPNNGVIDGIPSETYYNQNAFWIQKAVLKEFGYPVIKTVDQYFDLLEEYYKKYPTIDGNETIPFSIITHDWEAFNLWNPPQFLAGYPNDGNGHVDYIDGKYIYKDNFTDENAYKWFKLANGYYQRGLIDPQSFKDNSNQYYEKIAQGRVLGMFIQGWEFMSGPEQTLWANGKAERTYAPLAITFDESIKPYYRDRSLPNLQRGFGITVNCSEEKAIKILQFMDTMLEEENQKVLYWGFEGKDYFIDSNGNPYRTDDQRKLTSNPAWIKNNQATFWAETAPKLEGTMPSGYTKSFSDLPGEFELSQTDIDKELWAAYGVRNYAEFVDSNPPENAGWYPMWQMNPASGKSGLEKEACDAMNKFEIIQRNYLPKMITGAPEDFDATWNEYCEKLSPLTEVYNSFMQKQLDYRVELYGGRHNQAAVYDVIKAN